MSRGRRPPGGERTAFPDSLERHRRYVAGPMRDTVAALRQLFAVEAEFSDSAGHGVGRAFRRFAAPDAGKLGPAGYLFGPAAIETIFDAPPPNSLGPAWTPEWGSVAVSNDLGFTLGPAWPRQPGPNQVRPEQTSGRYFSIWKRQPDGSWRYVVD